MTNPNNYPGATLTLVGFAAGNPEYPPYDKEGKRGFKQLSVAVNEGYKKDGEFVQTGTTWYRIEKHQDAWDELNVKKGDKIRLEDAKQEVREYKNRDGDSALGITLSYGTLTILESKDSGDSDTPW